MQICGANYQHITDFAPTKDLLAKWQKKEVDWHSTEEVEIVHLK